MNRGVDVEFDFEWPGGGGHTVTVLQICRYLVPNGDGTFSTTYRVDYLEDDQGREGAQRIVKRIWINSDGSFRFNGNAAHQFDGHLRTYSTDRVIIPEDLNGDGEVNGADLGLLIAGFGSFGSSGDIDGDGDVDGADLGRLLAKWGPVYPDSP